MSICPLAVGISPCNLSVRKVRQQVHLWCRSRKLMVLGIHELAVRRNRYGYRRITVLLRREGLRVNRKRVHRIWKTEGLSLPLRRPKR